MRTVDLNQKRIKHISHNDLDGKSAHILTMYMMSRLNNGYIPEYVCVNPHELFKEIEKTLETIDDYDLIIITDLNITSDIFNLISNSQHTDKFLVFDHHISEICDSDNNYDNEWVIIRENEELIKVDSSLNEIKIVRKTCGTKLYYGYLLATYPKLLSRARTLKNYVELVRAYDTYEFITYSNQKAFKAYGPRLLNTLFHTLDEITYHAYIYDFIRRNCNIDRILMGNSRYPYIGYLLKNEERRNEEYINSKVKEARVFDSDLISGINNIAMVFADREQSMIGNKISDTYPGVDMVIIVSGNKVSLRTKNPNVDLSFIAKFMGGGGHRQAAGFPIDDGVLDILYIKFYNEMITFDLI